MIQSNIPEPSQGIPGQFTYLRALITEAYLAVEESRKEGAILFLEHAREPIDTIIRMIKAEGKVSQ